MVKLSLKFKGFLNIRALKFKHIPGSSNLDSLNVILEG